MKSGGTQDEYSLLDLQLTGDFGAYGVVTFGMSNVEDNDPLPDDNSDYEAYMDLYGNSGLITYLKYNIAF